ncbi:hypothetical protein [Streptomyces sp. NPDC101776]|uniref:hypothetical protein n=1 Tax=Streptomyces sp. NPDC101776 TaxID=3366146 RepID=UPI0037F4E224
MNHPRPHQLIQVPLVQAVPPPLMPRPTPAPPPLPAVRQPELPPPAPARRRRFRAPRALREDAFWTGALTAICIGGLLMAIIATT